jgi:uncharacterized membrane protein (DUF2068 family)
MRRPLGASILAIVLGFLGLTGLGNAYVMSSHPGYGTSILTLIALLYGLAALASAIGLWLRRRWAYPAFVIWAAVILFGGGGSQLTAANLPWPSVVVFLVAAATVLYLLARYIRRVTADAL